jgi:hypothetical protein
MVVNEHDAIASTERPKRAQGQLMCPNLVVGKLVGGGYESTESTAFHGIRTSWIDRETVIVYCQITSAPMPLVLD